MTCQEFEDNLYGYLDDTLDQGIKAAALEHLESCSDCRAGLKREQELAAFITPALQREVKNVFFDSRAFSHITPPTETESPSLADSLAAWLSIIYRHAGLARVCLAAIILALGFAAVQLLLSPAGSTAGSERGVPGHAYLVINAPLERESHFFEKSGKTVRDGVARHRAVAHARFH